jgi:hypothetical protein
MLKHSTRHESRSTSIISHLIKFYHLSFLIVSSSFSIKILQRRDISSIRFLIWFMMILSHSFNITCFNSVNVLHCRFLIRCLRMFHIVFDEFKSNDCEECDNVLIQLIVLKRTMMLFFNQILWLLLLFFCKKQYLSRNIRFSLLKLTYTNNNRLM